MLGEKDFDFTYRQAKEIVNNVFKKYELLRLKANDQESLYPGQQFDSDLVDTSRTNAIEDKVHRNLDKTITLHKFNKEIRQQIGTKLNSEERTIINYIYYEEKENQYIADVMFIGLRSVIRKRKIATLKLATAFESSQVLKKLDI